MADIETFTIYAVSVSTTAQAGTPVYIDQITEQRVSPNVRQLVESADGQVDPTYAAVLGAEPLIGFTTTDLKAALDLAALDGLHIDSDVDDHGIRFWLQALAEGGTRGGDGTNLQMTVGDGLLVPRTLQATQGQRATLALDCLAVSSDGSTASIALSADQNLTGTPSVSVLWTLGTVKINGADFPATDLTVTFGIQEIREAADGHVYPTYVAIMSRQPTITFTTPNAELFSTLGLVGAARSASTVVTFRKMSEGSTRVSAATEEHISLAVNEGRIHVDDLSPAGGGRYAASATITPTHDGTNAILVIDTTAAIT